MRPAHVDSHVDAPGTVPPNAPRGGMRVSNRQDRRRQRKAQSEKYRRLMKAAHAQLDENQLREAELGFKAAAQEAISEAEPHHMLALMAYQAGRLEEAGNHIVEASMRDEDDVAINADCGAIMNMLGRPAEAEAACRHVIDLDPDHVEAYNNLSVALSMQDRREEALAVCDAALERRPDYPDALVNKANLLVKMDDPVAAIEAFSDAIRVAPANPLARVNLGTALRMVGELEAAEEQCRFGIDLRPDYPEAHACLGMVLAAMGDFEAAQLAFREALKLRPGFGAAQMNLAAARFKAGDMAGAEAEYRRIIESHPAAAAAYTGLGIVLLALGQLDQAAVAFREAVTKDQTEGEAWMNLASALGADMPDQDIAAMTEMAEDTRLPMEQRIAIRFALGEVSDRRGETAAAFVHYRAGNDARRAQLENHGKIFDPNALDGMTDTIRQAFPSTFFNQLSENTHRAPVFVVGMPRSGTSLVEQILASHADVRGAGEVNSIGALIPDFPDGIGDLDWDGLRAAVLASLGGGTKRVVDKTPFQFLHLGVIRRLFPKAAIIHCRRDAMDTGLSCYFQNFAADYPWATDLREIGRYLATYEKIMNHWRAVMADGFLDVSYEQLIAEPESESQRMIDYLGLPWDESCLNFHNSDRLVLTASSWQVRKPIYNTARGHAERYGEFLQPLSDAISG